MPIPGPGASGRGRTPVPEVVRDSAQAVCRKLDAVPGAKDGLHLEHTTRREGWLLRPDIHTGGH
jgi:hypothetical protein